MSDAAAANGQHRLSEKEYRRLRRARIEEYAGAPREAFREPAIAEKALLELRQLCGALPLEGEAPDWPGQFGEVLDAVAAAYRGPDTIGAAEAALMQAVYSQLNWPVAQSADQGVDKLPERRTWLKDHPGAVLSEGTVCLLAGEGGVAKSTLALHLALHTAAGMEPAAGNDRMLGAQPLGDCAGLESAGGRVLIVTYEDAAAVCRWRLRRLARQLDGTSNGSGSGAAAEALRKIDLIAMSGHPLYGSPQGFSYNARPAPLPGWWLMRREMLRAEPVLIVIDPALAAYVGDSSATAVWEFLSALSGLAAETRSGVLLLAHSTKAARRSSDPFDPGHIGGSAAWHDGVRGALILARENGGGRVLRVSKSNYGPAYVQALLDPVVDPNTGAPLGFTAGGVWVSPNGSEKTDGHIRKAGDEITCV